MLLMGAFWQLNIFLAVKYIFPSIYIIIILFFLLQSLWYLWCVSWCTSSPRHVVYQWTAATTWYCTTWSFACTRYKLYSFSVPTANAVSNVFIRVSWKGIVYNSLKFLEEAIFLFKRTISTGSHSSVSVLQFFEKLINICG